MVEAEVRSTARENYLMLVVAARDLNGSDTHVLGLSVSRSYRRFSGCYPHGSVGRPGFLLREGFSPGVPVQSLE